LENGEDHSKDKGRRIKDERYGGESFSDLVGNHSTVARQNGWPGGDKERMEHGAGCMEYKDGD
jgi:hypothetical protein